MRIAHNVNAPAQAAAPLQRQRARGKRTVAHPGVYLVKPRPDAGNMHYGIKWVDLDTGKMTFKRLDVSERRAAEVHAREKSVELDTQRRAIEVHGRCAVRLIVDECAHYLEEASVAARRGKNRGGRLSPITVARYTVALDAFRDWCASQGLTTLRELTRDRLSSWKVLQRKQPRGDGELRMHSTVNFSMKPVRQMLLFARAGGRYESLDSDAIKAVLSPFPEAKPRPACLSAPAISTLLRTLIARDAKRVTQYAPVFALALLGGLRRAETILTVDAVCLCEPSAYDPSVVNPVLHVDGKTGKRAVELLPYSPKLVALLHAMAHGRKPGARLHGLSYDALGAEASALAALGGELDGFDFKTLRSTCASYQGPLPGDRKPKADRLGHTMAVAERSYLALPKGTPLVAASLDDVMRCDAELDAIIAAIKPLRAPRANRARTPAARSHASPSQPTEQP